MQTTHLHISVVTPVYGCKTCFAELYVQLKQPIVEFAEKDSGVKEHISSYGAYKKINCNESR